MKAQREDATNKTEEEIEQIADQVVNAMLKVHRTLGPGLLDMSRLVEFLGALGVSAVNFSLQTNRARRVRFGLICGVLSESWINVAVHCLERGGPLTPGRERLPSAWARSSARCWINRSFSIRESARTECDISANVIPTLLHGLLVPPKRLLGRFLRSNLRHRQDCLSCGRLQHPPQTCIGRAPR